MTKDDFHSNLRQYLHRVPFLPFVAELRDGRRIEVRQPRIAFCDGAASFIDPCEEALVEFYHDEVQRFDLLKQEMAT